MLTEDTGRRRDRDHHSTNMADPAMVVNAGENDYQTTNHHTTQERKPDTPSDERGPLVDGTHGFAGLLSLGKKLQEDGLNQREAWGTSHSTRPGQRCHR